NGGKNSLNRLIRCVCGKKIGPDPRNFNQRVSLGRNDLLIRTFPNYLFTPKSYWSVVVTVIWGGLVIFRGIRVFIMRGEIALWQQRRLQKILRSGNKRPDNKTTER
ncbi:2TM domain-containing protein, partial [Serratia marcescens]|nr:2TM domain-containing protein [Serratia marcescens]